MAWIPFYQELANHPKTHKLARMTGLKPREVIGMLANLWWYCLDYAPDGDVTDLDPEELARVSMWYPEDGPVEGWMSGLIQCGQGGRDGFIDDPAKHNGRLILHDWDDFTGRFVLHKEGEKLRQRKLRASKRQSIQQEGGDGSSGYQETVIPRSRSGIVPGVDRLLHESRTGLVQSTSPVPNVLGTQVVSSHTTQQYTREENKEDTPLESTEMFYEDGRPIDLDWVASIMERFVKAYPKAKCSHAFLVRTIGHYDGFSQSQVDFIVDQFCDNYEPKQVKNAVQTFAGWMERRESRRPPVAAAPLPATGTGNLAFDAMVQQMSTMGTRPASVSSDVRRMQPISLDENTLVLSTPLPVEYVERAIVPQIQEALNNVGWGHLAVQFIHREGEA